MNEHTTPCPALKINLQHMRFVVLAIAMSLITLPAVGGGFGFKERQERITLTGNWLVTVTRPSPLPILLSLQTYFEDGNVLEESNSTSIRSLAHGTWEKVGQRQFTRTWFYFRFDAARNFIGSGKVTATVVLSKDGQTFEATAVIETFDAAGNLISTTQGTESGKAI
jgi:hypothetical protein